MRSSNPSVSAISVTAGVDLVPAEHTRYGVLFRKPDPGLDFGTADAFGHDGAGGCSSF